MRSVTPKIWMLMAILCVSFSASAYDIEVNGIYYNIFAATKTAKVTFGETKYTGTISLPATIEYASYNLKVVGVDKQAFSGCTSLTTINLSENISSIGADAFQGCSSLTDIKLPESVKRIDSGAFSGCTSLTTINIPENTSLIGANVFKDCSSLTEIKLSESVTSISSGVFRGCSSLKTIILPGNIWRIEADAFHGCSSLTELRLPQSVSIIYSGAFSGCTSLTTINLSENISIIDEKVFEDCSSLTKIKLPETIASIGNSAFSGCTSLSTINLPESVTKIDDYSFYGCSSLKNLDIPNSICSIGYHAFFGCNFEHLSIGSGIDVVSGDSLWGCRQVNTLEFKPSSNPLKLGDYSYWSNGQESIGGVDLCSWQTLKVHNLIICRPIQYLYRYYEAGKYYYYENPVNNMKYIESISLFDNFVFETDGDYVSKFLKGHSYDWTWTGSFFIGQFENLKQLSINCENINEISKSYISQYPNLKRLVISGLKNIGENCFKDFLSLDSIQLNDVENIKKDAFLGCTSLKHIVLPASLKTLSNSIVSCPLESITLNSDTPPSSDAFPREIYLNCKLFVPSNQIEVYQHSDPWKNFWNLAPINGINDIENDIDSDAPIRIYTINGMEIRDKDFLPAGIYIMRQGSKTKKIAVGR